MKKYCRKGWLVLGIVLAFIVMRPIVVSNLNAAKEVIFNYDVRSFKAIKDGVPQNYQDLIANEDLLEFVGKRDNYNIDWYRLTGEKVKSYSHGGGWGSSYWFFNTLVIRSNPHSQILFTKNPTIHSTEKSFSRITVLKKVKGKWYIIKDIQAFDDELNLKQVFDSKYTQKQIEKYKSWQANIEEIVAAYSGKQKM